MALTEQERDLLRVIETETIRLDPAFAARLSRPAHRRDRWLLWLAAALVVVAAAFYAAGLAGAGVWMGFGCVASLAVASVPMAVHGVRRAP